MADIEMNSLNEIYLKRLSSRLLDYIETVNMGLLVYGSELGNLIVENGLSGSRFHKNLEEVVNQAAEPLNRYLDSLFNLQSLATIVELELLPDDFKEDAIELVENERQAYKDKVEKINKQISGYEDENI